MFFYFVSLFADLIDGVGQTETERKSQVKLEKFKALVS
jgi:hypothetical protein